MTRKHLLVRCLRQMVRILMEPLWSRRVFRKFNQALFLLLRLHWPLTSGMKWQIQRESLAYTVVFTLPRHILPLRQLPRK